MATYTSYLNLEKPTTSETFNLLKMNQNWDKIDAGVSALNSNLTPTYDALTLESGITGTLRILRMGKLRSIYGNVRPSSTGTEIVVCTLANTDIPPINLITSYSGYGANATGEVNIYSDGRIVITADSAPANGLKFSVTYAVN